MDQFKILLIEICPIFDLNLFEYDILANHLPYPITLPTQSQYSYLKTRLHEQENDHLIQSAVAYVLNKKINYNILLLYYSLINTL